MLLVGFGGVLAWAAFSAATGGVVVGGVETAANFAFMGAVLMRVVCGLRISADFSDHVPKLRERGTLQRMTESLSVRSQSLEHAAVTDGLTGMYNRRYFDEALTEYLHGVRADRQADWHGHSRSRSLQEGQ
jgi:two-component system cell cycle response regulator